MPTSSEQRRNALAKANRVRIYRAGLKCKLAAKEMTVAELFDDEVGAGMRLDEMLNALPSRGKPKNHHNHNVKLSKLSQSAAAAVGVPLDKRCNELTPRQREQLLKYLATRNLA
jgi:hypothetical protein